MDISVEISLYPLDKKYLSRIDELLKDLMVMIQLM